MNEQCDKQIVNRKESAQFNGENLSTEQKLIVNSCKGNSLNKGAHGWSDSKKKKNEQSMRHF